MPNRFAPLLAASTLALAASAVQAQAVQAQPASAPAQAAPTAVAPVTVEGVAKPKVIEKQAETFVEGHAATPDPNVQHIARWRDEVCVMVLGLPDDEAAMVKARIEDVARSVDVKVQKPGCHGNLEVVFTPKPQALMDGVYKTREQFLGYYHYHDGVRLKQVTRPIQAWYATASKPWDQLLPVLDDPENSEPTGGDPFGNKGIRDGVVTGFANVLVVVDTKALEGKALGPVTEYVVMLALSQPVSQDGCQGLPSVMDLLAPSGCPGRTPPDGLTPADAAYLTALYDTDLEVTKNFELGEIENRMSNILVKANVANAK